jgi:RNA polymerase primary sigma factor
MSFSKAYKVLKRVHRGELPFDRTVQVSVTDRLEKEQILGRLPHNLRTLEILLKRNEEDYRTATQQKSPPKPAAASRLGCGSRAVVVGPCMLIEELGLRTQRIEADDCVRSKSSDSRVDRAARSKIDANEAAKARRRCPSGSL